MLFRGEDMKKFVVFAAILAGVLSVCGSARAEDNYFKNMGRDLGRGTVNMLSSPLEIPITIGEYHDGPGYPVVRHVAGLSDGVVQFIERFGSGFWDYLVAFVPGAQDGLPPDPPMLF